MKTAIIGTGYISAFHARAYNELNIEIAAVHDQNPQQYQEKKDLYQNAQFYSNLDDLLARDDIDIVNICVPNRFHYDIITRAAAANKHIFTEKTLTADINQSRKLYQLLKDYPKNFQIGYMKRYFPATSKALELLPEIGDICSAYIHSYQSGEWPDSIYDSDGWRGTPDKPSFVKNLSSAGMLNMAGSHMLDLMHLLIGKVKTTASLNWSMPDYDVEMTNHALFNMANGSRVHFEASISPYTRGGYFHNGWDEVIQINGKLGRLQIIFVTWNQPLDNAPFIKLYRQTNKTWTDYTFPRINPFTEEIRSFVDNCQAGTKSKPDIADALEVDRVIAACYQAADQQTVVNVQDV